MTFNTTFDLLLTSNCKINLKNELLITTLSKNEISLAILSPLVKTNFSIGVGGQLLPSLRKSIEKKLYPSVQGIPVWLPD